jgi:hypothetical protein
MAQLADFALVKRPGSLVTEADEVWPRAENAALQPAALLIGAHWFPINNALLS